jgi:hypothetical protein
MENGTPPELARAVNDRIYNVLWGVDGEVGEFLCECGDKDCVAHVELRAIEYAAGHGEAVLAPGHQEVAPAVL